MSKVIKFRYVARHTHEGSVRLFTHTLDLHSIEDTIDVIDLICSEIDPCTCCFNEAQNHCDCDSILDHGEFEIISRDEFTGMLDENGIDIYEGDIVESDYYWPDFKELAVIGYDDVEMKFCFNGKTGDLKGEQDAFRYGHLKVIGNINQTPELLND